MLRKIKFMLFSTVFIGLVCALIDTDWKCNNISYNNIVSFEDFCNNDIDYVLIKKRIDENDGLWHPYIELKLRKELKEREIILKAKYELIKITSKPSDVIQYLLKDFLNKLFSIKTWFNAFFICISIFLIPLFFRAFLYFIVAPIIQKMGKLQLFESLNGTGDTIHISKNEWKSLKTDIRPGESLLVVDETFVNGTEENKNLKKSIKWLLSWKHPIMSFFCGLRTMNKYTNRSEVTLSIDITSENPDDYFIEITLDKCKGAFILPSNIKALSPTINIDCKWRLFSLVSWCMLRMRYYIVSGSGKIILSSTGGFSNKKNTSDTMHRRKPSSLIFADTNLEWNAIRTEVWYPYIFGKTELFDILIKGDGNYLIKNILEKNNKIILNSPESFLNIIGKLAGF